MNSLPRYKATWKSMVQDQKSAEFTCGTLNISITRFVLSQVKMFVSSGKKPEENCFFVTNTETIFFMVTFFMVTE